MRWSRNEIERLHPILEQISHDLFPVDGKNILVQCSGQGEMAFWLGEMMEQGKVTGVELDPEAIEIARRGAHEMGLESLIEFIQGENHAIPLPEAAVDGLVSEFIVYPTVMPTQVGQAEMSRVLKPGGRLILTDVLVTRSIPEEVRQTLELIGLDYLCEGSADDFQRWMKAARFENVAITDLTPTLRAVWESRRAVDRAASHQDGYAYLLDHPQYSLGKAIYYFYIRGDKPKANT